MSNTCTILNVRLDTLSLNEVLTHIHHYIDSASPHHVVTVNTEYVMQAQRDPHFKNVLDQTDIALADGAGIVFAAKILKQSVPPRIPGVDFVHHLAKEAAEQGYSLYLLGGQNGVGQKTADILTTLHPGLKIVGVDQSDPDQSAVVDRIKSAHPDILLVAWGAPKQDLWINLYKNELKVPVMMGVGGTFDFIAGKQKRAPRWMRDLGLEWLWRLVREPSRWRRQLDLPRMFWRVMLKKIDSRNVR